MVIPMKTIQVNQFESKFESMLMNINQDLINDTIANADLINKIAMLRIQLRIFKNKNMIMYKRVQREYLSLVR